MKQITAFTDDYIQQLNIVLDDGSFVPMSLIYVPAQQGWWYSIIYGSWQANLMRVVNSPNMLRRFRNIIPFGFACTTIDGYEIINQSDFVSGRASFFVLNSSDVAQVEILITQTLPQYLGYSLS